MLNLRTRRPNDSDVLDVAVLEPDVFEGSPAVTTARRHDVGRSADAGPMISIRDLQKTYPTREGVVHAVRGVSIDVQRGEFVTLLGPSGCGKTTTLRSVAGLEVPTGGQIVINGRTVFDAARHIKLTPAQRNLGMVFQSYAIWPHMTVFQNVEYPLKTRKVPKSERVRRTNATLALLGLELMADRPATNLSGGQQQRVAVARALVSEADVILFDEPLSNLDAKLRKEVRQEIRDLQQRLGITVLYVTHDQEEAMAISDRIIVLEGGTIKEEGPPERIYSRPTDVFAARFMGDSNIIPATLLADEGEEWLAGTPMGEVRVARRAMPFEVQFPHAVLLTVRPEHLHLATDGSSSTGRSAHRTASLNARVEHRTFLGPFTELVVRVAGGQQLTVRTTDGAQVAPGDRVDVLIEPDHLVALASDVEAAPAL